MFFSPFSIAITSLGEERANLSAFRTFIRFVLVWICRFPLPLGVWEGLRFVIVVLPGLFSYLFFPQLGCRRDKYTIPLHFFPSSLDFVPKSQTPHKANSRAEPMQHTKDTVFNPTAATKCSVKPGLLRSQAPQSPIQVLTAISVA